MSVPPCITHYTQTSDVAESHLHLIRRLSIATQRAVERRYLALITTPVDTPLGNFFLRLLITPVTLHYFMVGCVILSDTQLAEIHIFATLFLYDIYMYKTGIKFYIYIYIYIHVMLMIEKSCLHWLRPLRILYRL